MLLRVEPCKVNRSSIGSLSDLVIVQEESGPVKKVANVLRLCLETKCVIHYEGKVA
ncbi:hypothetical protein COOONC_09388 [Cooperia oncophora]